jgi:DNA polymerase III subunit epsilon
MNSILKLHRPIIFFDLETTGTDITNDCIVELAVLKINPDGTEDKIVRRFNPGIPIPAEATAVHGITNDDVQNQPSFSSLAAKLAPFFKDADMGGFNILRFDMPLLVEEFLRAGVELPFDQNTR